MVEILQKYFKKGITSILILSIFGTTFLPLSFIYAQTSGGYSTGGNYPTGTGITGGIGANITALSPLISNLPLCREKVTSKVKGLFRDVKDVIKPSQQTDKATSLLQSEEFEDFNSIEVIDKNNQKANQELKKDLEDAKKSIQGLEENDTCLKSIGRLVTKMLLQKMTVSTVEWINNGFEGKPLFLQNPGKFFGDIATNELLQFKLEIDDARLYPFGRAFLKSQVNAINTKFSDNARYSLNELISQTTPEYNAISFGANFSYGGWAAWDALTQVPANNPLGFNILASNELSKRLEGTSFSKGQEVQKALDQAGGFLGDERCVDPDEGITRASHNAALIKGEKEYKTIGEISTGYGDETVSQQVPTGYIIGTCKKWEYVTPGKLIAESATKAIGYTDNNLLAADDLNSSIAAIMDALLNRWSADIANKGFANFDTEGANGSFIYDNDNNTTGAFGQVDLDFPKSFTNSSWLRENPDFNIRTDLTQALIDEQRIYQQRLEEENRVLNDLITTVRQLDYCIPGPHPGYEDDSEIYLANEMKKIPVKTPDDMEKWNDGDIADAVSGIADTFTLGLFSPIKGIIDSITGENKYQRLSKYYASIALSIAGIPLDMKDTKITGKHDLVGSFETIFNRYIKLIKKYYTKDFLPTITPQARTEFRKISGYEQKIENNEYAIYTLTGIINRLSRLKDKLDELDPESTEYETYLPMINEFGRLSASMVTGNDIARVIDDVKESEDQIRYVYNDLLTGPYGCEKDLENRNYPTESIEYKLLSTLRTTYPFAIWYDYNRFSPNESIRVTDPGSISSLSRYGIEVGISKIVNKMPSYHAGPFIDETTTEKTQVKIGAVTVTLSGIRYTDEQSNNSQAFGPGFLSRIAYDFETEDEVAVECRDYGKNNNTGGVEAKKNLIDCLIITDLFIGVNRWPSTIGRKQGKPVDGGPIENNRMRFHSFEQLIGVY